ncbi:hypothetical protein [Demequina salsinemoris]|uniref:hypothetical protein n=1 Tax=Demequina salsinemoris TaxID=577470 RepID=UPI001364B619|nr:hypothetical protein [Demequina salsinemoris]
MLGWFVLISPQLEERSALSAEESQIRSNITTVEAASAKIDEYAAALDASTEVTDLIAVNAPSVLDMQAFRDRLSAALTDAQIEITSMSANDGVQVDGWDTSSAQLVSASVASLFTQGPVAGAEPVVAADATTTTDAGAATDTATATTSTWSPAITVASTDGEDTSVAGDIRMVEVTIELAGSPSALFDFLADMQDPDQQLFQVSQITLSARTEGEENPAGSPAKEGDVSVTIVGDLYLHDADTSVVDEDAPASSDAVDGAFVAVGGNLTQP